MKAFATFLVGLLTTAAVLAALWFGAPYVFGETPPPGLLGMIGGLGLAATIAAARRARMGR